MDPTNKIDKISKLVAEATKGYLKSPNIESTRQALAQAYGDVFKGLAEDGKIDRDFAVSTPVILWKTMAWKEKALWFLCNWIVPVIGRALRRQCEESLFLYSELEKAVPIAMQYDLLEAPKLPSWANQCPRSVLVTDVVISPVRSAEAVIVDYTIR